MLQYKLIDQVLNPCSGIEQLRLFKIAAGYELVISVANNDVNVFHTTEIHEFLTSVSTKLTLRFCVNHLDSTQEFDYSFEHDVRYPRIYTQIQRTETRFLIIDRSVLYGV